MILKNPKLSCLILLLILAVAYSLCTFFGPFSKFLPQHAYTTEKTLSTLPKSRTTTTTQSLYQTLAPAITSQASVQALMAQDPGRIQLIDFFSYGCYGCMRWRPFLDQWLQAHPGQVVVYHLPILFNAQWEPFARAYYIAKSLDQTALFDTALFKAVHEDHLNLTDLNTLGAFFAERGIPAQTVAELYDSFGVNQEMLKAKNIALSYQITVSPSIVLNTPQGSYLITPDQQGKGEALLSALDALLARAQPHP